jgi:hypothetical protein
MVRRGTVLIDGDSAAFSWNVGIPQVPDAGNPSCCQIASYLSSQGLLQVGCETRLQPLPG